MEKGKKMVSFEMFSGGAASPASQDCIVRLLEKNHDVLYGSQDHFNNYVKRAIKNAGKEIPVWEKYKDFTPWEQIDITPYNKLGGNKVDMGTIFTAKKDGKAILSSKEQAYLKSMLAGEKNDNTCKNIGIGSATGKRIKKTIIGKLKSWTKKDNGNLWDIIDNDTKLSSRSIADLRYRTIPLSMSARADNEEKIKNSVQPITEIDKTGKKYTWKKKNYSGKITAPVVAKPTKKPENVWYAIPVMGFTRDHGVTIGKMRNIKIEYDAKVYARSHIPEFFVTPNKRDILCEKPAKKPAMVEADRIETDYYETDIRLINRR